MQGTRQFECNYFGVEEGKKSRSANVAQGLSIGKLKVKTFVERISGQIQCFPKAKEKLEINGKLREGWELYR